MSLVEVAQICTIIIASCSIIGLCLGCLHVKISDKIKEIDVCGREIFRIRRITEIPEQHP
jgi:hypothetical protein